MKPIRHLRGTAVAIAAAAIVLTAPTLAVAQDDDLLIIGVLGPLSDPFFSTMQKGADDAAAANGVTFDFTAPNGFDNLAEDLARLIDIGITREPDAMVIGNFIPDAENDGIARAVAAGITVVVVNTGLDNWEDLGAISFVGEDPLLVGAAAAKNMIAAGISHGLCVDHVPGNPGTTARCVGYMEEMAAAGKETTLLNLPYSDSGSPERVMQAITGLLRSNQDIDGIFTLGTGIAEAAMQATEAGFDREISVGTADVSVGVLNAVKEGEMLFAIDQQPYLQTYYGVTIAAQSLKYDLQPIGQIKTGPLVIDASNVDIALETAKLGVRGAQ